MKTKKTEDKLKKYAVYQKFYNGGAMMPVLKPGSIIQCKEYQARCVNYLQPMTLRLVEDETVKV